MTIAQTLNIGEPAPWFSAACSNNNEVIAFDELAGRYIVLFFFGRADRPDVAEALDAIGRYNDLFDGKRSLFLGISNDPNDLSHARVCNQHIGQLFLRDSNGVAAERYGVATNPVAFFVSPSLQIVEIVRLNEPAAFVARIAETLRKLLANPSTTSNAPVLVVPSVFDRSLCRKLIELYDSSGGREIGQIETDNKIVERFDPNFRKRLDWHISDKEALSQTRELLERRLLPLVYRAFQFSTTRIERYLVGCYDASRGGYFRPHRDNTAPIVAHRRFALTINLNEDYEGGNLCFPEFSHQTHRAAPGDAIVFSCSLLHEVTPVTHNRRYAFLSFLYDEQSQRMRDAYREKWHQVQNTATNSPRNANR